MFRVIPLLAYWLVAHHNAFSQEPVRPPEKVAALRAEGKYPEALAEAKAAFEASRGKLAEGALASLLDADAYGNLLLLMGRPKEAEPVLREAVRASESRPESGDAVGFRLLNDLGVAQYQLAEYPNAFATCTSALDRATKVFGPKHLNRWLAERNLAFAQLGVGDYKAGEKRIKECVAGLLQALEDPKAEPSSGAEAELIAMKKPSYPRILLTTGTYVSPPPSEKKESRSQALAKLEVGDRVQVLRSFLEDGTNLTGLNLGELIKTALSPKDYRQVTIRYNFGNTNAITDWARLPAPFDGDHPVGAAMRRNKVITDSSLKREQVHELLGRAKASVRESHGEQHPAYADLLDIEAIESHREGNLEAAEAGFARSRDARIKAFGGSHPEVAKSLSALSVVAYYRGDPAKARRLLDRAMRIRLEKLPDDHADTVVLDSDLAALLKEQGDYATARGLLEKTYRRLVQLRGPDHTFTRAAGNNLAVIQAELGDFAAATSYFSQLLAEEKDSKYPQQRRSAELNLAGLARLQGMHLRAAALYEKLRAEQPDDPFVLNALGGTYRDLRAFGRAEPLLRRSVEIRTAASPRNPDTAFARTSLGMLLQEKGDYEGAVEEFRGAAEIYREQLGDSSRRHGQLQRFLGTAEMLAGRHADARTHLEKAVALKAVWARDVLPGMSEADAVGFLAGLGEIDPLLSVMRKLPDATPADAYAALWATRGLVTQALLARRRVEAESPESQLLRDRLQKVRVDLSSLLRSRERAGIYFKPFAEGGPNSRATFDQQLLQLAAQKERLERELAAASEAASRQIERVRLGLKDLFDALPRDHAVVEFVRVNRWPLDGTGATPTLVYEAFVIRPGIDGFVQRVDLGPAREIDNAVSAWRARFARQGALNRGLVLKGGAKPPSSPAPDAELRKLVWEPIAPRLEGCKTVIVVPDGELTRLPFAALPGKKEGTYLVEETAVVSAPFGAMVAEVLRRPAAPAGKTLLVGGISYDDAPPAGEAGAQYQPAERSQGVRWGYLPGTKKEVEQIGKLAPADAETIGGALANRMTLTRSLARSRFAHLATHGYFSPPEVASAAVHRADVRALEMTEEVPKEGDTRLLAGRQMPPPVPVFRSLVGRNPLVLSGLVLAGANSETPNPAGGILTGEEIVDLELSKCEMVVLSACETGLGTVGGGEGVFGLQRAFALAGVRTTVASLWQIDDAATTALMGEFYRRLWGDKLGKADALRAAQLWMLTEGRKTPGLNRGMAREDADGEPEPKDGRLPPFYWAAFSLAGDWR